MQYINDFQIKQNPYFVIISNVCDSISEVKQIRAPILEQMACKTDWIILVRRELDI